MRVRYVTTKKISCKSYEWQKKYRAAQVGEEKISGTMKISPPPPPPPHQKSNGPPLSAQNAIL